MFFNYTFLIILIFEGPTAVFQNIDRSEQINGYLQLLYQREEEYKMEVDRLSLEIKSLKLQIMQLTGIAVYY